MAIARRVYRYARQPGTQVANLRYRTVTPAEAGVWGCCRTTQNGRTHPTAEDTVGKEKRPMRSLRWRGDLVVRHSGESRSPGGGGAGDIQRRGTSQRGDAVDK